jgi:phosphate transport system substrate-binding protein
MFNFHFYLIFCISILYYLTPPPVEASPCFCAKSDKGVRYCGKVLKLDPDDSVTVAVNGVPIDLKMANFAECGEEQRPSLPPVAAKVPETPPRPAPHASPRMEERFGIYGSNTIGEELMPQLIKGYARQIGMTFRGRGRCDVDRGADGSTFVLSRPSPSAGPGLSIDCKALGTHVGIPALAEGRAEIAMLSHPITRSEEAIMLSAGVANMSTVRHEQAIALDGIRVVVSPQNRAVSLTRRQIAQIFAGEITDWSELNLPGGKINLYVRDIESGTRQTFEERVLAKYRLSMSAAARPFTSSKLLSDEVAADPNGIGFIGYAYLGRAKTLAIIEESCSIVHDPSILSVKTEDYLLSRRLYLYVGRTRSAHVQGLMYYTLSDAAQPVIRSANFIDQSIEAASAEESWKRIWSRKRHPVVEKGLDSDPKKLKELAYDISFARRLSIDFRFRSNAFDLDEKLDTKALQDVIRLAEFLKAEPKFRRVLLLGFADSRGTFKANLALSQKRADTVKRVLLMSGARALDRRIVAKGYSELLPVSCNRDAAGAEEPLGLEKNRRVEVYLLPD